jgi:hypothetical protein
VLYVPLGGLRAVIERPDKVRDVLACDRSGDDLAAELTRRGWDGGMPWDGRAWIVPRTLGPPIVGFVPGPDDSSGRESNRFCPGRALVEFDTLPGREPVIQELLALVDNRSPAILRGPRRSGKTSILHVLRRRLGEDRTVRHATLEGTRVRTADDLARWLEPDIRDDPRPAETLRNLLRAADRPVLLLDEVAHLGAADGEVFAWLRGVGQDVASLVLVGSHWDWLRVVERAAETPGSSFGNDVTPVNLGPMDRAEAVAFLVATAPGDVPIEAEKTATWIVELCGPWPFYLQVMGYAVVQAVQAGKRRALVDREGGPSTSTRSGCSWTAMRCSGRAGTSCPRRRARSSSGSATARPRLTPACPTGTGRRSATPACAPPRGAGSTIGRSSTGSGRTHTT